MGDNINIEKPDSTVWQDDINAFADLFPEDVRNNLTSLFDTVNEMYLVASKIGKIIDIGMSIYSSGAAAITTLMDLFFSGDRKTEIQLLSEKLDKIQETINNLFQFEYEGAIEENLEKLQGFRSALDTARAAAKMYTGAPGSGTWENLIHCNEPSQTALNQALQSIHWQMPYRPKQGIPAWFFMRDRAVDQFIESRLTPDEYDEINERVPAFFTYLDPNSAHGLKLSTATFRRFDYRYVAPVLTFCTSCRISYMVAFCLANRAGSGANSQVRSAQYDENIPSVDDQGRLVLPDRISGRLLREMRNTFGEELNTIQRRLEVFAAMCRAAIHRTRPLCREDDAWDTSHILQFYVHDFLYHAEELYPHSLACDDPILRGSSFGGWPVGALDTCSQLGNFKQLWTSYARHTEPCVDETSWIGGIAEPALSNSKSWNDAYYATLNAAAEPSIWNAECAFLTMTGVHAVEELIRTVARLRGAPESVRLAPRPELEGLSMMRLARIAGDRSLRQLLKHVYLEDPNFQGEMSLRDDIWLGGSRWRMHPSRWVIAETPPA